MPPQSLTSWSIAELIAFQTAVADAPGPADAVRAGLERAVDAFAGCAAALLDGGRPAGATGFPTGRVPGVVAGLTPERGTVALDVPGLGRCVAAAAEAGPEGRLVLLRDGARLAPDELALLRGMAQTLALVLRALGAVEDERRLRAEHDRQTDERDALLQLRTAFDDAEMPQAILSVEGHYLHVNRALSRALGRDRDDLIGRDYRELLHPEDREVAAHVLQQLSGEADSTQTVRRFVHRAGHVLWAEMTTTAVPSPGGGPPRLVVQARDITERKRAEVALAASEERYRRLVERLPMVTLTVALDADATTLFVSPQIEALTGWTPAQWRERPDRLRQAIHPDDRADVLAALARAAEDGSDFAAEYRMVAGDGREVVVRHAGTVTTGEDGRAVLQGFLLDVSERHRLEEQLRLAQKLESVGQLAAGVAHEINTPVQFIGDSLSFVREATTDLLALVDEYDALKGRATAAGVEPALLARLAEAEEIADLEYLRERLPAAFARTEDGVERVATIVSALRELAHPPAAEHAPVDLNAVLRRTLVVTRGQYRHVADVETELAEGLPEVPGDAGELGQVFINLVVNATHAIEERVGDSAERGLLTIATAVEDDAAVVRISDTGCGMPEDVRRRIFDPFFTTKPVGRGTGQGLAIARSIIDDRHAGSIAVRSQAGRGTTFEIRLPLQGAQARAAEPAAVAAIS